MGSRSHLGLCAALLAFGAATTGWANPSRNPGASLDLGRLAYERGDYSGAITTLSPLLYPSIELGSEEQVVEAHRLLALSFLFSKKEPEAQQEVESLLSLRPNFELDPVVDPPMAIRFFAGIRVKQDDRLREIRRRQREEERARKDAEERARKDAEARKLRERAEAPRIYVEKRVENHTRLLCFVPFGVGQAQNHQIKKAVALAVGELALGATWASLTFAISQLYPTGVVKKSEVDTAHTLQDLQVASGVLFWTTVAYGVVDALIYYKPEIVTTRELPGPPAPPHKPKASLTPILAPGLVGLGVQGAF